MKEDYGYDDSASKKRPRDDSTEGSTAKKANTGAAEDDVFAGFGEENGAASSYQQPAPATEYSSNGPTALVISELHWWTNDEDLKSIATDATGDPKCVKDVGFFEHKVNGKSRGTAYMLFTTAEAAAKTKERLDKIEIDSRKPVTNVSYDAINPFRTMPKEPPNKAGGAAQTSHGRGKPFVRPPGGRGQAGGFGRPPYQGSGGFRPRPAMQYGYERPPMGGPMGMAPMGRPPMGRGMPPMRPGYRPPPSAGRGRGGYYGEAGGDDYGGYGAGYGEWGY
ncbi:hypothetical protein BKA69DRAFT_1125584 [Paraphysoderma sedebokerense]|nr:hypothetical protein BKA69DRAFT_1125584 [Paraphysoderma sedebokerense]